jgi:hypothetical protein
LVKNAKDRLLARAARNRRFLFAGAYRAAAAREQGPTILFQQVFKEEIRVAFVVPADVLLIREKKAA